MTKNIGDNRVGMDQASNNNMQREGNYNNNNNSFNRQEIIQNQRIVSPYQREFYKSDTYYQTNDSNLRNQNLERTYRPAQNLQISTSSDINNYKYQSQTEKLEICKRCGKPKRPNGSRTISSHGSGRKSISRKIIGEQSSNGEYIIRYGEEENVSYIEPSEDFEIRKFQEPRIDNGFSIGTHYCPIHGYV